MTIHWYALVLYKRFLTPFPDGIWNRRKVSVGDRGFLPPRSRTVGDRPSWHIGWVKMSSCVIEQGIETQLFPFICASQTVNPRKTFPFVCISHTVNPRRTFPFSYTSQTVNPGKTFPSVYTSHTVNPGKTFPFVCTSHTINPGKTFPFVCTSHTVLCIGSYVKGVTITHALPWLTVCFNILHHT